MRTSGGCGAHERSGRKDSSCLSPSERCIVCVAAESPSAFEAATATAARAAALGVCVAAGWVAGRTCKARERSAGGGRGDLRRLQIRRVKSASHGHRTKLALAPPHDVYRGVAQLSNTPSAVRLGKYAIPHCNPLSWRPPKCLNPTRNSLTSHWPSKQFGRVRPGDCLISSGG